MVSRGFPLIEMLQVVVILGLASAAVSIMSLRTRYSWSKAMANR